MRQSKSNFFTRPMLIAGITALSLTLQPSFPLTTSSAQAAAAASEVSADIPAVIQSDLKSAITELYGPQQMPAIYAHVAARIAQERTRANHWLDQTALYRRADWYKEDVVYMLYADRFGLHQGQKTATFDETREMLPYLKTLGVTTLYILPFMGSPMGDAGFDISQPNAVRDDLGGMAAFDRFIAAAKDQEFKIKSDLILNHVSDQISWFQDALKGDTDKLDYFVVRKTMPEYRKYRDPQKGVVIDYKEDNGKTSSRRLIFPDMSDNHYRKVTIDGKDYYIYHTFYPFQLDLNWENPKVAYAAMDIMDFWANKGIDIFRMDAIPYFIKTPGTNGENQPQTHAVVKLLSAYLQATHPQTVILAEACEWPKDILPYFGKERTVDLNLSGYPKELRRTDEVQMAYNFPYMPGIWASLITADSGHFWEAFQKTPAIPPSAAWAVFLRVHDELTLEMVDIKTRKLIYDQLVPHGAAFRQGLGVSGRMADFLGNDPNRIGLAFSILLSQQGIPIIYYGDEIGAQNDFDFAKTYALQREIHQKRVNPNDKTLSYYDSRDINRAPIAADTFINASLTDAAGKPNVSMASDVFHTVQHLITIHKSQPALMHGDLKPLVLQDKALMAYTRNWQADHLLILHNLSGQNKEITLKDLGISGGTNLLSGQDVGASTDSSHAELSLSPYQSMWIKLP